MLKKILFLLICCSCAGMMSAQTGEQEAKLKAVFIYNFTRYIDWNTGNDQSDFVIGIAGPSDIIAPLEEIAKTNLVNNRKIVIHSFNKLEDIGNCNVIFIPSKSPFSLQSVLDRTGNGVLTISEEPGFAQKGTAFNFVVVDEKLKFEANLKALYLSGLKASSQLLKLAIIVN